MIYAKWSLTILFLAVSEGAVFFWGSFFLFQQLLKYAFASKERRTDMKWKKAQSVQWWEEMLNDEEWREL